MSDQVVTGPAVHSPALASDETRLRQATRHLEGVFVEQLFKAMRETVPAEGMIDGGTGEEIFSGLLDEHLAAQVPDQWERGLGEALYRQLRAALPSSATGSAATGPAAVNARRKEG